MFKIEQSIDNHHWFLLQVFKICVKQEKPFTQILNMHHWFLLQVFKILNKARQSPLVILNAGVHTDLLNTCIEKPLVIVLQVLHTDLCEARETNGDCQCFASHRLTITIGFTDLEHLQEKPMVRCSRSVCIDNHQFLLHLQE